jgi:uncharacterized protein (DUF1778 family)
MKKKTPEQLLRALEKPLSPDEEMERLLSMTEEDVDHELRDVGVAPEAVEAQAEALLRLATPAPTQKAPSPAEPRRVPEREVPVRASGKKEPAKVIPLRPRAPRLWARIAAAAAVLGPVGFLALSEIGEGVVLVGAAPDAASEKLEAAVLRSQAADALEAGQWARCLALLDEAKQKDPQGDEAPGVKDARRFARSKLGWVDGARP